MKRIVCFMLTVCMMCAFLAACSGSEPEDDGQARELRVIFYGSAPDTYGIDISIWKRSLLEEHEDASAPRSKEIELLGKKFAGEYQSSRVLYPAAHLSHIYQGEHWTFAINSETGEIDSFNTSYKQTDESYTQDECKETAMRAADRFIDTDEYTLNVSEYEGKYYFQFTKYVEDMPTKDMLSIAISKYTKGFCTLGKALAGSFEVTDDSRRAVRRLKAADKESVLEARVQELFTGKYKWSHSDYTVFTLPGGTVALYTKVTVSTMLDDVADGEHYSYPSTSDFDAYIFETPEGYVAQSVS